MRRSLALLVLIFGLLVPTWVHTPRHKREKDEGLELLREPIADPSRLAHDLGPLRLERAWQLKGPSIGGYSALSVESGPRILAESDGGRWLRLDMSGQGRFRHALGWVKLAKGSRGKENRDTESMTRDPATGTVWMGMEGLNAIVRLSPQLKEEARVQPPGMQDWGENSGPESLVRLSDGRFLVLCETPISGTGGRLHEGLVFAGDPTRGAGGRPFRFEGPRNFSAVDMAQLPDGRVLILMRRLIWPMPMRFAGRIVIADPAQVTPGGVWPSQTVAVLASDMPVDNFEGLAVHPRRDGRIGVWLISDDNFLDHWQRTLLWQLSVDPAQLPWPAKRPG